MVNLKHTYLVVSEMTVNEPMGQYFINDEHTYISKTLNPFFKFDMNLSNYNWTYLVLPSDFLSYLHHENHPRKTYPYSSMNVTSLTLPTHLI